MKTCEVCKKLPANFDGQICWYCKSSIDGKIKNFAEKAEDELREAIKNNRNLRIEISGTDIEIKQEDK